MEYTYDGSGHMLTLKASLTTGYQETKWIYGTSTSTGDVVNSNDILKETRWPDTSTGNDGLNQLTAFRRGALSDANSDGVPDTVTTASRTQTWAFDALGNFDGVTTDGNSQTRSHNKQNEITSISSATTLTYDANGNLTADEAGTEY